MSMFTLLASSESRKRLKKIDNSTRKTYKNLEIALGLIRLLLFIYFQLNLWCMFLYNMSK